MITLYQYSFDVGYPKPYIHICAYCEEEAIDKFKTLYPEVKWFELYSHPKVIKRIETDCRELRTTQIHVQGQPETHKRDNRANREL